MFARSSGDLPTVVGAEAPLENVNSDRQFGIDLELTHRNKIGDFSYKVKEINPEKNEVVLASLSALEKTEMWLKDWNLVNQERTLGHSDIIVKIRYRKQENHATITITPDHLLHVQLHEPLTAIAPGQAAAFYKDGLLLGGGIIVNAR